MNTTELMKLIVSNWPFDENSYPDLATISDPAKRLQFCVDHIVLKHLTKNLGVFAGFSEPADHGHKFSSETERVKLRETAIKMVQSTIRLAALLEISAEELEKKIRESLVEKEIRQI